jgi:hypothetical protein
MSDLIKEYLASLYAAKMDIGYMMAIYYYREPRTATKRKCVVYEDGKGVRSFNIATNNWVSEEKFERILKNPNLKVLI